MDLGKLVVPLLANIDQFKQGLDEAAKIASTQTQNIAGKFANIGGAIAVAGIGALTAAVGVGTATIVGSINATNEWAGTLDDLGDIMGGTTEENAGMALMFERVGMSGEDLTGAMAKLANGLTDSKGELGTTGKALQNLGINFKNLDGTTKTSSQLFQEISDKVGNMPEGLDRTALQMELFGKSGKNLSDALSESANGGMQEYIDQAKELGLAMSPEQVQNTVDNAKAQEKFHAVIKGLEVTLGSKLIPIITNVTEKFSNWLANPEIQAGIDQIATKITNFVNIVIAYIPTVISVFQQLFAWFQANPGVIIGILATLGAAVVAFGISVAISVATAMAPMLPVIAIIAAIGLAVYGLYQLWTTNFLGIQDKTSAFLEIVRPIFDNIVNWFKVTIPIAIQFLKDWWDIVFNSIKETTDMIFKGIKILQEAFSAAFSGDWYTFGAKLRELWDAAWKTIVNIIKNAWEIIKTGISNLVTTIRSTIENVNWGEVGMNIIKGVANGITAAVGWIKDAAVAAARAAYNAALAFLKIGSPSKLFYEMGKFIPMGMAEGIDDYAYLAVKATNEMVVSVASPNVPTNDANNIIIQNQLNELIKVTIDSKLDERIFAKMLGNTLQQNYMGG